MKKFFCFSILMSSPLFSWSAYASDACQHLSSTISINQCKQKVLQRTEKTLEQYWQQALKQHSKPKQLKQALEHGQRLWLQYQEQHCQSVYQMYLPGTIAPSMMMDCKIRLTQARTLEIWQAYIQTLSGDQPALPRPNNRLITD